jgi:acyl carrier protein
MNKIALMKEIKCAVADILQIDASRINMKDDIRCDLGMDSLDMCELQYRLEAELDIVCPDDLMEKISTVQDFVEYFNIPYNLNNEEIAIISKDIKIFNNIDGESIDSVINFLIEKKKELLNQGFKDITLEWDLDDSLCIHSTKPESYEEILKRREEEKRLLKQRYDDATALVKHLEKEMGKNL